MKKTSLDRVINILEQCRDTLDWQEGRNDPNVDFLMPKIKYALTLLGSMNEEEDESHHTRESTTGDALRAYTFDFALSSDSADEEDL
jgi:hypothetical protein